MSEKIVDPAAEPVEVLKHIESLDGIRGLAVFLVLSYHLLWSNNDPGNRLWNFAAQLRGAGWIGVDIFFALSGFLITGILFDSLHDQRFFRNFYGRRVLRIFPLFYGLVVIAFLLDPSHRGAELQTFALLFAYLQNTELWWRTAKGTWLLPLTGHLWSLAIEEQFYLVWPVIVFLVRDRRKLLWTAFALALLSPLVRALSLHHGASLAVVYHNTLCRADSLLGGAWLALIVRGNARSRVLRLAAPCFWIALGLCGTIAWRTGNFDWEINRAVGQYGYSALAVASLSLIAMALRERSLTAKVMRIRPLRFLGKYSYGLYVFHIPMAAVIAAWQPSLRQHIPSRILYHLVLMSATLALTIPVTMLSFHFYEKPFLKLKRFFNYERTRTLLEPGRAV
jgi:peptidoglycan/LPS O-acetylase OafA/YrhL